MEKIIILADVTCDLPLEVREQFGITDYIKGHVHFSDGRDFKTALDWDEISRDDFYKALSDKRMEISTAPASPEEYYETFKRYALSGYKIISVSISSKISSTYNVAQNAANRVKDELPDSTVYCFDSNRMSGAVGLLVINAAQLRNEGKSFDEIVKWLEDNKNNVHQMGPIDDLIFVARRGRLTMGKAIMGSFAGVKPMGDCNKDGYVTVLTKVKGIRKALEVTEKYVEKTSADIQNNYVIISHSNREAYAQTLKTMIEQNLSPKQVFVCDVFSGSGTNIGPGMVAAYYLGRQISDDLSDEKDIMAKILENSK